MNIKILDSWIREHLKTGATPLEIAEKLSLTSLSVEKIEKSGNDFIYEFEITTNRPDLYSVLGIAKEANAILPQFGIKSSFLDIELKHPQEASTFPIEIENNPKLVNRICAVLLDVNVKPSPEEIKKRLEASGIRSLNNVIDITNYVMRLIGHPAHVFDLDRLNTKKIIIKEAKAGEKIITLDKKTHTLKGGEIVALNDNEEIVDLLGIMGLENSVVTDKTKRILFFIDNNEPTHIRKASMGLAIRSEAAVLNEKGVDPELALKALEYGIELYKKIANAKVISKIIDIYPNKLEHRTVDVSLEKVNKILGVTLDIRKLTDSLEKLGFELTISEKLLKIHIPSYRLDDIKIEEDVIEEIARIYGYHNLPSILPHTINIIPYNFQDRFYWENLTKQALKYWGFTETYTYSFVSEEMFEADTSEEIKIQNPLTEDFVYMRNTIVPSLLKTTQTSKRKEIKIFELANVYLKTANDLPKEALTLAGIIKKNNVSFFEAKGYVQQLLENLGINNYNFDKSEKSGVGAGVYIGKEYIGEIEIFDQNTIDFELNFEIMLKHSSNKKSYKPLTKFPPVVEDLTLIVEENISTQEIISAIKLKSGLIREVSLKDQFENSKTFHIVYQSEDRNLTQEEVSKIREKIIEELKIKLKAEIK